MDLNTALFSLALSHPTFALIKYSLKYLTARPYNRAVIQVFQDKHNQQRLIDSVGSELAAKISCDCEVTLDGKITGSNKIPTSRTSDHKKPH